MIKFQVMPDIFDTDTAIGVIKVIVPTEVFINNEIKLRQKIWME